MNWRGRILATVQQKPTNITRQVSSCPLPYLLPSSTRTRRDQGSATKEKECPAFQKQLWLDCLITAWQLPYDYLTTAWQLVDDCMMITWWLPIGNLMTACLGHDKRSRKHIDSSTKAKVTGRGTEETECPPFQKQLWFDCLQNINHSHLVPR